MRALTTQLGIGVVSAAVALVLLLGPLDTGIWTTGELAVFDRTRAALGTALSGLVRSPWLPDAIRTATYQAVGAQWAFRLPHALAAAFLVGMTSAWARRRGARVTTAYLAGAFALSFPLLVHAGATGLGNPIGEAFAVGAIWSGLVAVSAAGTRRLVTAAVAVACLGGAIASAGLLLGGAVPLAVLAAGVEADTSRRVRIGLWTAAAVAGAVVLWLSAGQGDGYIPLLGASKDPEIVAKPELRRFGAGLAEAGYQLFPWTPLVIVGAMATRGDRWPAIWLGLAVTATAGWSTIYGPGPAPIVVPAALCAAAAVERLDDPERAGAWRRVVILGTLLGIAVLAKDASLIPSEIAAPLVPFVGEHTFPAEGTAAPERLGRIARVALLAVFVAGLLSARHGRLGRLVGRLTRSQRGLACTLVVALAALYSATYQTRSLMPALARQLSPRTPLRKWRAWAEAGALPETLGNYRIRDDGLDVYGPEHEQVLRSRRDVVQWLAADEPRVVLVRERDVAPLYQQLRERGLPLYVLDTSHQSLRLVANVLPPDAVDENTIPSVLLDEPLQLRHETYLKFGEYMEIIGWEVTDPIIRGRDVTYRFMIRALRPLPAGTKLYARLLKGRSSRLNAEPNGEPTDLTNGVYPPNLWREGDLILHEVTFTAPWLEIQWGPHELFVGLRRSERQNIEITVPEGKTGEFGVRVRGDKRHFATLGEVEVW